MRLGLVIYGSLDTVSGGYLYDRELVAHLRRQGDTVEIVSLPWRGYAPHLGDNLSPRLRDRLAKLDVDVLLQDELNHPSLFTLNRRLPHASPPRLAIVHHLRSSEHHPAWLMPLYRSIERRYLGSVHGLIYNSFTTRLAVEACTPPPQFSHGWWLTPQATASTRRSMTLRLPAAPRRPARCACSSWAT